MNRIISDFKDAIDVIEAFEGLFKNGCFVVMWSEKFTVWIEYDGNERSKSTGYYQYKIIVQSEKAPEFTGVYTINFITRNEEFEQFLEENTKK